MALLLYVDPAASAFPVHTPSLVHAALAIDETVDVLLCGYGITAACEEVAKLQGIRKVLYVDHETLQHPTAEEVCALILSISDAYKNFASTANSTGKDIMPRLAAQLDVMQISDLIAVLSPNVFKRPIYAGNAIEVIESLDDKKVFTIRSSSFPPVPTGNAAPIVSLEPPAPCTRKAGFVQQDNTQNAGYDLDTARIIVSGGRALGSKENFDILLGGLAKKLHAALGASRSAVDAGFAPNDWQIGQTGKIVAPDLYIAVGLSGAIQHLAGMKDSKVIVAINKDPHAPIVQHADFSLIGDLFEIIPQLTEAL